MEKIDMDKEMLHFENDHVRCATTPRSAADTGVLCISQQLDVQLESGLESWGTGMKVKQVYEQHLNAMDSLSPGNTSTAAINTELNVKRNARNTIRKSLRKDRKGRVRSSYIAEYMRRWKMWDELRWNAVAVE
ncbi:unnamed protein product [Toxocara canis]|uniref:Uncharacterized protein n=1 Tax=Toxocara canis TaxID=6265 RepID=A0A183VBD0_TOXCA|nr:unnamed protein product [Toxocara canis]